MSFDTGSLGLRTWNSFSSTDLTRLRPFSEKRWLGRSVSCPALIPCHKAERAWGSPFFQSTSSDGSESEAKKHRTSLEDE